MRCRGRPKQTAVGRAYLELLRTLVNQPPALTTSEIASLSHDLAQPRQSGQGELFVPRRQGR